jgi:hypothetical protein
MIMVLGTIVRVEIGAQGIQYLKRHQNIDIVVGISFVVVLVSIASFVGWESWRALKLGKGKGTEVKEDVTAVAHVSKRVHRFHLPPMVSLPVSGIEQVSLWAILAVLCWITDVKASELQPANGGSSGLQAEKLEFCPRRP